MESRLEFVWSLSGDNTHSWVRFSHGSNKFVMDSNNSDTEVPEDQLEEQALHLNAEEFVGQPKAKAKPQRKEPADSSSKIISMNRRNWIDIEPGKHSLSACEVSKKVIHLLFIGLTIDGKYAWQQEEEQKGDFSTALMIQE